MTSSTDKFITHSSTLEKANKIRIKLLNYKPHPCVYVYQTDHADPDKGYDVHVSNEWGSHPSDELFNKLTHHIKDMVEEQPASETESPEAIPGIEEEKILS